RKFILICVCFFLFNKGIAQKNRRDYLVLDSLHLMMGIVTYINDTKVQFQISELYAPTLYFSNEVKEFYSKGEVYESFYINGNFRFYKKIVDGDVDLYKNGNLYAIKSKDSLIHFSKSNYKDALKTIVRQPLALNQIDKLKYSKNELVYYLNKINKGVYTFESYIQPKLGAYVGANFLDLNFSYETTLNMKQELNSPTIGLFTDLPISRNGRLLFVSDIGIFFGKTLLEGVDLGKQYYTELNLEGINTTAGIKWVIMNRKIRPYVKLSLQATFVKYSSPTNLIEIVKTNSVIEVYKKDLTDFTSFQLGNSGGIGVEYTLKNRKIIHAELRHLNSFIDQNRKFRMQYSGISFFVGFSI
ncbi:MAG: hypothetical protein ACOVOF_12600, partial [Chryseotalea sp.]